MMLLQDIGGFSRECLRRRRRRRHCGGIGGCADDGSDVGGDAADAVDAVLDGLKTAFDVRRHVLLPVIASTESLIAKSAFVGSFAGVKTHVDLQLKTEAETFSTLKGLNIINCRTIDVKEPKMDLQINYANSQYIDKPSRLWQHHLKHTTGDLKLEDVYKSLV